MSQIPETTQTVDAACRLNAVMSELQISFGAADVNVEQTSLPQRRIQHYSDQSYLFVVADGMFGRTLRNAYGRRNRPGPSRRRQTGRGLPTTCCARQRSRRPRQHYHRGRRFSHCNQLAVLAIEPVVDRSSWQDGDHLNPFAANSIHHSLSF